jgi:PAS domain S-box-containing protein
VPLIRERFSQLSIALFLMALAYSEWFLAFTFMYSCNNESVALFWAKAGYIGVPCIPAAIYMFVIRGLGIFQQWKRLVLFNWMLSFFFSVAIVTSDAMIGSLYHYWWGFYPKYGWLSVPFLIYFFTIIPLCVLHAFKEYRKAAPGTIYQTRIKYITIALGIASIGVVDFVAKYGIPLYPFGYVPFMIFTIMFMVLLRRFKIVEITPTFAAQAIISTMSDALIAVDITGTIHMVNQAACTLFHMSEKEMIGRTVAEFISTGISSDEFTGSRKDGTIRDYEARYTPTDGGGDRILSIAASTILELGENPVGEIFVIRDITELKEQEAELKVANMELNARQKISEQEMALAANIQFQLFPNRPPFNREWDIAFFIRPMMGVSGDFYDFYETDGKLKGISLFDVSGHGISSGLITLLARSIIARHFNMMNGGGLAKTIENINGDLIAEIGSADSYLTGILLRLNGNAIEYVNASHPGLVIKREKTGSVLQVKPHDREMEGTILGKEIITAKFDVLNFTVSGGDALLVYTDGLTESYNASRESYGEERLYSAFKKSPSGTAREIIDFIIGDFNAYIGTTPTKDDITLMIIKKSI